ncbi:MAG: hypothetical protein CSA36_08625 [Draconibacterium sp.]|nr:MAG: hypothetical protein CSA36_08625 [Draconibacterium sp.]
MLAKIILSSVYNLFWQHLQIDLLTDNCGVVVVTGLQHKSFSILKNFNLVRLVVFIVYYIINILF